MIPLQRDAKLKGLLDCGVRRIFNLMETGETGRGGVPFDPYVPRLQELAAVMGKEIECLRFPIRDAAAPSPVVMRQILDALDESVRLEKATYLHCWGGHGRTSTVVACHLIRHGCEPRAAVQRVMAFRRGLPKSYYPFEGNQEAFVLGWTETSPQARGDPAAAPALRSSSCHFPPASVARASEVQHSRERRTPAATVPVDPRASRKSALLKPARSMTRMRRLVGAIALLVQDWENG